MLGHDARLWVGLASMFCSRARLVFRSMTVAGTLELCMVLHQVVGHAVPVVGAGVPGKLGGDCCLGWRPRGRCLACCWVVQTLACLGGYPRGPCLVGVAAVVLHVAVVLSSLLEQPVQQAVAHPGGPVQGLLCFCAVAQVAVHEVLMRSIAGRACLVVRHNWRCTFRHVGLRCHQAELGACIFRISS